MPDLDPVEVTNLDILDGSAPLEWSRARALLSDTPGPEVTHFLSRGAARRWRFIRP
jgi:hypothetical protein